MPAHVGTIATIARPNPPGGRELVRCDESDPVLRRGVPRWRSVVPVPSRGISNRSSPDPVAPTDCAPPAKWDRSQARGEWSSPWTRLEKADDRLVVGKA